MTNKNRERNEWIKQCKNHLRRSLRDRIDFGFVYTYKPILDDAQSRIFDSMEDYRKWCNRELPRYLGYRSVD